LFIMEKALGPDHLIVAAGLNNLALLYSDLGEYAKAEPLYKRSLAIKEKALNPDHPDVATSLNNLAGLYHLSGDYAKAEPMYKRSLAISEKAFGPDHPDVANGLNNLAGLYRDFGNYAKAEPLYKRSLAISEKAFGPDHPDVANSLNNLAVLYAALDDFEKAHDLCKRAQFIDSKLIDQVMGFTSEDQKTKFLSLRKWDLYFFLSLINQHFSQNPSHRKDALDVWLKRKGIILEAQKRFQEALVYSDDSRAVKTFQELAMVRAQLSKLIFAGPGKSGLGVYKRKKADLEAQKERLEARLSQLSQSYAAKKKLEKADSVKVAGMLPLNSVLIEFASANMFNFKAKKKEKKWDSAHYLAFVLHAGNGSRVGMIDLGNAEKIDEAVAKFKKEISNTGYEKGTGAIKSSRNIYKLVFAPLVTELGDVKKIFISPDGNLNLIPFEVLQGPDGRYLIEDYTFNYLAAGRDILGFGQIKEKGGKALLMGDPDFELGEEGRDAELRTLALKKEKEPIKRSSDMSGFHFSRLPGTREEVKAIHALLGKDLSEIYTGKEALEELLNRKGVPSILHLATHGFFLEDMELAAPGGGDLSRGMQLASPVSRPKVKRIKVENPLLRSGFALAGANRALASGDSDRSDGIVTAEKILGLRLRGTDMVVLSACETGVGEIKTGEGVFGLRRAFTQAGAKSMVMSMWSVPDQETKELMIAFYRNILSGNMNRCQALRRAALQQMQIIRERYGSANPFYWGAFVFMGEP
ncbi:MAG: CHAT domain-containing protein, partial [Deltaproteobacteria bacterium]|nr:CHAT domain-containing protein [Deltaproteobacteria bacterium]